MPQVKEVLQRCYAFILAMQTTDEFELNSEQEQDAETLMNDVASAIQELDSEDTNHNHDHDHE